MKKKTFSFTDMHDNISRVNRIADFTAISSFDWRQRIMKTRTECRAKCFGAFLDSPQYKGKIQG